MSTNKNNNQMEWFKQLRLNSWEVEILIVGFVLVVLFQLPDLVTFELQKTLYSASWESIQIFLYGIGKAFALLSIGLSIKILTYSFSTYLLMRGFWVGVLGLSSVYPDGINISKLNFNKKFANHIRKYNFNNFIVYIDNICSSIFAFSFLLSLLIISFVLLGFELLVFIGIFEAMNPNVVEGSLYDYFMWFLAFIFGIPALIYCIDIVSFSLLKKIKWKPFAACYYYVDLIFKHLSLFFIYDHLYYAFISNIKRRFVLLVVFLGLGLAIFQRVPDEYDFFAEKDYYKSTNVMQYFYYENQFPKIKKGHKEAYPYYPFIQSDIISSNYLKLHIPYFPEMNAGIKKVCPELKELNDDEFGANEKIILDCINKRYTLFIDDKKIDNDFIFYNYIYEHINLGTYFMVIPLHSYFNGRHSLKINRIKLDSEDVNDESKLNDDLVLSIPFYLFRD